MKIYRTVLLCLIAFLLTACSQSQTGKQDPQPASTTATQNPTSTALSATPSSSSEVEQKEESSQQSSNSTYFKKGMCGGLHSIYIDKNGDIYTGSLGDKTSPIRVRGSKSLYRITQDGTVTTLGSIQAKYITGIITDKDSNVYVLTSSDEENSATLVKVSPDGNKTELSSGFSEAGDLRIDSEGNVYYSSDKVYKVSPKGEVSVFFNRGGLVSPDFKYVYSGNFGGSAVTRYSTEDKNAKAEIMLQDLKYIKNMAFGPSGTLYVLDYASGADRIVSLDKDGNKKVIVLDTPITNGNVEKLYMVNNLAVSSKDGKDDFAYLTTWNGDIIKLGLMTP